MEKITVVDAMMGRGKTSAAIRYMTDHAGEKRFLYVTPYLSEVDRVCERCDFDEPDDTITSKSQSLREMMSFGINIATTHSLFTIMDNECLQLARDKHYTLIVDEEMPVVESIKVSTPDMNMIMRGLAHEEENGHIVWDNDKYSGAFSEYMEVAKGGNLYRCQNGFYELLNPERFTAFDEAFLLTYMFDGSLLKGYFEYFGIPYEVVGVESDELGVKFSDKPDEPPAVDYSGLIDIVGADECHPDQLNAIGDGRTSLSANWYKKRSIRNQDVKKLRCNLRTFFDRRMEAAGDKRIWTTFKSFAPWLYGPRNRYSTSYLPLNLKATNEYRSATVVAYLVNRFIDPTISRLFESRGVTIDADKYATAEMLQFIWRSAIREGNKITLYIPSKRMRTFLKRWIKAVSQGDRDAA